MTAEVASHTTAAVADAPSADTQSWRGIASEQVDDVSAPVRPQQVGEQRTAAPAQQRGERRGDVVDRFGCDTPPRSLSCQRLPPLFPVGTDQPAPWT